MNPTIARALAQARAQGLDRLDAQLLLAHELGRSRAWLLAHDDEALAEDSVARFAVACEQRARGMPLAYLVGTREFHGLMFEVGPDVLVPRPETELLVDWALALLEGPLAHLLRPRVLDLGTGSGAIALAVARACPRAQVLASDRSEKALAVAQCNASRLGLDVQFRVGDWWSGFDTHERFDLVVSNPPYIAGDDPHLSGLAFEPRDALTPGGDGLGAIRQIIGGARNHLTAAAWLLLEHGWDQADAVAGLLRGSGFTAVTTRPDLQGHPRCTGGAAAD